MLREDLGPSIEAHSRWWVPVRERSPLDPALYWRNISRAIQIMSAQLRTKRSCLFCFGEASARQAPVDFSVRCYSAAANVYQISFA